MTETLFAFSAFDVYRLRQLLAAFEQGRLNRAPLIERTRLTKSQDTFLGRVTTAIPAMSGSTPGTGTATYIESVDPSGPTVADITGLDGTFTVLNVTSGQIGPGYYVFCYEPTSGYYVPVSPGNIATLTSTTSNYTMGTSWANTGLSISIPAGQTWVLQCQLTAQITSSASGAGDSLSFRLYDGSAVVGKPVECCNAVCDSLMFVDAAPLVAAYTNTGGSPVALAVQGIINTSSASAGTMLGGNSYLLAWRAQ